MKDIPYVDRVGFKNGANQQNQNKIKAMIEEGKTAFEISEELLIHLPCVESYFPEKKKSKAKPKPDPVKVTGD